MVRLFRFLAAVSLLVWLGVTIAISFYVAPSLFANESGRVENSSVAGDIVGPLLHKMALTAWIAIPLAVVFQFAAWSVSGRERPRVLIVSTLLLAAAWCGSLYSGAVLTSRMQDIRRDLGVEYGGYHLAPKENPQRARFASLHGQSMVITLSGLLLGLGAFYFTTQSIGYPSRDSARGGTPGARD
jgi:polyferredoxin